MSGTMAQTAIVGRLTRDAELKYTTGGAPVLHFSVATNDRTKKGDAWIDEPSFWECDLWGKQAESLAQYMTKGKLIALSGTMKMDTWEKDGDKKSKVKVTAQTIALLGGDKHEEKQSNPKPELKASVSTSANEFEDSVPF